MSQHAIAMCKHLHFTNTVRYEDCSLTSCSPTSFSKFYEGLLKCHRAIYRSAVTFELVSATEL